MIISRLCDLARRRDSGNYCTFSPFLTPDLLSHAKNLGNVVFSGGYPDAERCVAAFLPDYMSEKDVDWPISLILIAPSDKKRYSHRDYLGSLMSLGIKRQVLGDIIVCQEKCFLFCAQGIEEFILNNLTHVAGTSVTLSKINDLSIIPQREYDEIAGSIAAERLDCVVALATKLSRTKSSELITGGSVMVNNRETVKTTHLLKNGDRVSVRGKGKFIYDGVSGNTKKGRLVAKIRKYK